MAPGCGCSTCRGSASSQASYASSSYGSYGSYGGGSQYAAQYAAPSSYGGYSASSLVPYSKPPCGCPRCIPARPACKLSCATAVQTEMQYTPSVTICDVQKNDTSFGVEVDVCAQPRCYIQQQPSVSPCGDPCRHKCSFVVQLCCPFTAQPRIVNCGPNPSASFKLDVGVDTRTQCRPAGRC